MNPASLNCDGPAVRYGGPVTPADASRLVLSLFPGAGLLDRAFEQMGFCVVNFRDLILGGNVRRCHVPRGVFAGVIGGPPCQDFSKVRRAPPTGEGLALLREFLRIVAEGEPDWFLMENVPCVPSVTVRGYRMQRIDLDARECGCAQRRLRHIQWGSRHNLVLTVTRRPVTDQGEPTVLASEGEESRPFARRCELQGLPADFDLPGFTREAASRAVGNGVPLPMGRALAKAVLEARHWSTVKLCACSCGRTVTGKAILATVACRQRFSRRNRDAAGATDTSSVTQPALC